VGLIKRGLVSTFRVMRNNKHDQIRCLFLCSRFHNQSNHVFQAAFESSLYLVFDFPEFKVLAAELDLVVPPSNKDKRAISVIPDKISSTIDL
jgi:hypothetical protein